MVTHSDLPPRGPRESSNEVEQGRLTGPGGPGQRCKLTGLDRQGDFANRPHFFRRLLVNLPQIVGAHIPPRIVWCHGFLPVKFHRLRNVDSSGPKRRVDGREDPHEHDPTQRLEGACHRKHRDDYRVYHDGPHIHVVG